MQPIKYEEHHRNIHSVRYSVPAGGTVPLLIVSDVHFDSKKCDRDRLAKHFREARDRGCFVLINGDWFDLMQGRYDPRHGKYDIRPEYKRANYIDEVIRDSADWLAQWDMPMLIGQGNHETNILKRLETNPSERLVEALKHHGKDVRMGGYSGWFVVKMQQGKSSSPKVTTFTIHYHHGSGGNAPRSKGVMKADINQMQNPDADMIIRGHDHNKWHLPITVKRLGGNMDTEYERTVHHLQTGSYKMQGDRFAGWETEKGFNTPRMGGWFVTLRIANSHNLKWAEARVEEAY